MSNESNPVTNVRKKKLWRFMQMLALLALAGIPVLLALVCYFGNQIKDVFNRCNPGLVGIPPANTSTSNGTNAPSRMRDFDKPDNK